MMKTLIASLVFVFSFAQLSAQEFTPPKDFNPQSKEEYADYTDQFIAAVNWLQKQPVNDSPEKRKEVNAFVLLWLSGTPDVSISLHPKIATFMDCADCLMIFMGSWAKYSLKSSYKNDLKGSLAGIEGVMDFYTKNKSALGKNKAIEKYFKLKAKNKLEDYVKSNM